MKKLVLLFAAATLAVSVSAQTVTESKTLDNIYIGINGGVATKTTGHKWLRDLDPNFGVRIGRYFTPVFGLAIEGNAYLSNKPWQSTGTAIRAVNTQLLGTVNLSNWFGGYKGEPRAFEVSALYGLGWGHVFGAGKNSWEKANRMTSKAGLDFAFNLGKDKAWQIYIEPAIIYGFLGQAEGDAVYGMNYGYKAFSNEDQPAYNKHNSFVQLNAGIVYKFKNSNGTHNFTIAQLRDQAEIDELNRIINDLRNRKPEVVTKEVVKEVQVGKEVRVDDLVFVTFAVAKYNLTPEAKKALDSVKEGAHVQIVGTASPEGNAEKNQILSQNRANAVADYLKSRGVIVDEAIGKGVQGTTSNRLAIVYVK
ncbi:MAG: OmpA family protein [Prevotella sp.]|nr:OmpA family protein [Prevotella sp.]